MKRRTRIDISDPSISKLAVISSVIADLFLRLGEKTFNHHLLQLIRTQVGCDSVVVMLYRKGDTPKVLLDEMSRRDRDALHSHYFSGAYLLSPFYLHWLSSNPDVLVRLAEISPEGFFESIYYKDYYARSGLIDELAYIIPLEEDGAVLLSMGRIEGSAFFSETDKSLLQAMQPIIMSAIQRHFLLHDLPPRRVMKNWLEDGLRLFGSSVLTDREQEVVQMMLRGYSSKSCARALDISPTTERVHRRKIYSKLGIASQAELFSLFFTAMSRESLQSGQDPFQQS